MKTIKTQKNGNNVEWIAREGRKYINIEKTSLHIIVKVPKNKYFKLIKLQDLESLFCDFGSK